MDRLERLILPIVLAIGAGGLLLAKVEIPTAILIAKVVGCILLTAFLIGFGFRIAAWRRREREYRKMKASIEDALAAAKAEAAQEAATAPEK
ncbi:MAG TPA: hypothetical protein ENK43_07585 [Planctomycetes bacterium]|nr:hypothetical protein [Planctomycetota bacterium]